jgi:hypothetical protein
MSKQLKRRRSEIVQSSKQPSKVAVLAELLRLTGQAATMEISRDYFRANGRFRDKWNMHWPSFKAFLAAASEENDLYYAALVQFVTTGHRKHARQRFGEFARRAPTRGTMRRDGWDSRATTRSCARGSAASRLRASRSSGRERDKK